MYCGYITTIKEIHKHSNADRLACATIFGNNVIVDLTYEPGKRVVYFPVDGQLSEEFCKDNDLVRRKDESGKQVGGYLDPDKRNIRAIKLRGEKSEGLALPIESLSKYCNVDELKDGDQITILNGHEICCKYIPKRDHSGGGSGGNRTRSNKERDKQEWPLFEQHVETEQLAYNESAFKPGDTCYITLKMHGCFSSGCRVNLWAGGRSKTMSQVQPGDIVIGFKDGKLVPSKVLDKYNNGKETEWQKIIIERNGMNGEKYSKILCTPDHLFYDWKLQKYIRADSIRAGDEIMMVKQTPILSREIKSVLLGMYLGDGHYVERNRVSKLEFSHKIDHSSYLEYIEKMCNGLVKVEDRIYISGYGTQMMRAKTKECVDIYDFFNLWINKTGGHKLTDSILDYFDEISLAYLYMDDGSLSHSSIQTDRAAIAICDYDDHDATLISKCISNLGIENVLFKDPDGYNRIRINREASIKLFDMISRYIPAVMRYKLPEEYRNRDYIDTPFDLEYGYKPIIVKVDSSEHETHRKMDKFDLHTETNNYVVGGILVHNSSGRTSNTIHVQQKKQTLMDKILHRPPKYELSYDVISGTRRTVLRDFDHGYYGNDAFRKGFHDFFAERLPKNTEIFYEIVGWVDENTPIMGRCKNKLIKDPEFVKQYGEETVFHYGCKPGESRCFVYRMTMTNQDGFTVEIPTEQCKLLCEKMGVEFVPIFEKFFFTTWDDLMQRVEKYYDGPDPIGKTHIREGVVVRIENREKFEAYKHKNFSFKCLSGIIADNTDADKVDEEILSEM